MPSAPEKAEIIILREPMQSANGLGIGLYQAARQAESMGYCLEMSSNHDGAVTFSLRGTLSNRAESASG